MPPSPQGHLKKDISLFGAFAIALGTTISGGFFLMPGLAFAQVGPAILVAYLVAGLIIIPPLLCKSELATAMPRAGGVYFYLDRSMGPMVGAVSGIGTWASLTLKTAFSLVGSGYYISLFMDEPEVTLIAIGLVVIFGIINILGTAKTSLAQNILITGVLVLLAWFIIFGIPEIKAANFADFSPSGTDSVIAMIGIVMISYMGISKLASVAEEIRNPERNIPVGIFLALGTAIVIYMAGLAVMIGVMPAEDLSTSYTPAADAATFIAGSTGRTIIAIAAIACFLAAANAGILSASRYPLAMARDHVFPACFRQVGRFNTPTMAIIATGCLLILEIVLLDPLVIAKYAGTIKMLLFASLCVAVIVMRESRIHSYDPGFRTPFYPLVPVIGFLLCIAVIGFLGWEAAVFAAAFIAFGIAWFWFYARGRVRRYGAIYHVFARVGENRFDPLDIELRSIIKEKGLRKADPFDELIASAPVIDHASVRDFELIAQEAAALIAYPGDVNVDELVDGFVKGTRIGATPVSGSLALPHMRLENIPEPRIVLVRIRDGLDIEHGTGMGDQQVTTRVTAIFFLASPLDDPALHLRLLAKLAGCVEEADFEEQWTHASDATDIRQILLRNERFVSFVLRGQGPGANYIGQAVRDMGLPKGCLVAVIHRGEETIIPRGDTILDHGDLLTIIGEPDSIAGIREQFEMLGDDGSDLELEDD